MGNRCGYPFGLPPGRRVENGANFSKGTCVSWMMNPSRLWLLAMCLVLLLAIPGMGRAHPSDFETLTIDLIFGPRGLVAIDAAVVESTGPSYEPGPTIELREDVARRLLESLQLATIPVETDFENSERYHWVGFTVRFPDPSLGDRPSLTIDSGSLQDIAADIGLEHVKLSVCHTDSDSVDPRDLSEVSTQSGDPGCQVWRLTPQERAISTTITLAGLPATGVPLLPAVAASTIILLAGLVLLLATRGPSAVGETQAPARSSNFSSRSSATSTISS